MCEEWVVLGLIGALGLGRVLEFGFMVTNSVNLLQFCLRTILSKEEFSGTNSSRGKSGVFLVSCSLQ